VRLWVCFIMGQKVENEITILSVDTAGFWMILLVGFWAKQAQILLFSTSWPYVVHMAGNCHFS
jgi:hypothetical protein